MQATEEEGALRRRLGFWAVTASGVGVILGAGVYALVGPAAGHAGGALWLAFLLAAVVAGLTAHSYARFAAMQPKDSPEYQYTTMAFGRRAGFTAGWLMIWADLIACAAVALGFGGYLAHLLGLPVILSALLLLGVLTAVTLWGIGESVLLAVVFTAVEVVGLTFVIVIGVPSWGQADVLEMPQGLGGVWTAAALAFFAYLGFDELGNLAEETRDPVRVLPRSIIMALAISTAFYMLVALSAVSIVGWETLSGSAAPLAVVAGRVLGARADTAITLIALAATTNTVLLLLVSASRSLYGMANAGILPKALGTVGRRRTPWIASLLVSAFTVAFVLLGDIEQVAQMTNSVVLVAFILVNLALFWVTRTNRSQGALRWVVRDGGPPLAGAALCLALLAYTGWTALAVALMLGLAGLVLGGVLLTRLHASAIRPIVEDDSHRRGERGTG